MSVIDIVTLFDVDNIHCGARTVVGDCRIVHTM